MSGSTTTPAIRALVVDDSSSMRRLLGELLRERGYDVMVAASGEEAVRLHIEHSFELVLVDWTLPGMSGLEVCAEVRALEPGGGPVLIVATAKSRPEDVAAALDAGATDFLSKPFDPAHLLTRLAVAERAVRDERERREEQAVLRFTENRFKHMVQNLPGVAFQCELDGGGKLRFSYVSSGIRELLHITPEQAALDPDGVFRLLRGEDGAGASLFSRFQGVSTFLTPNDQTHVTLADGTRKWIQVMGRPGRQKDGRVVFDGIMIDVTEHRRAQQALRASEEAFRSLIESSPDSVLVLRSDRVVYANPEAVRYLGYEFAAEILGRSIADFLAPEDREAALARWQRAGERSERPSLPIELRLVRADGRIATGEATDMPVFHGGHMSVLILVRDLTERKEMQRRLVLADRMASVGTLAAGVAHEINNPLSYVMSNLRLTRELLDASLDPEALETMRQQLDEAIHGADRMRNIVFDLKTFSQVDSEQRDEVEVAVVLESSINICWNEIRHRARLVKEIGPTPPVTMNGSRLGQVFLNLLINAAQAMLENRAESNVLHVRAFTDDEGHAVVEVRDTGEGISEANLARIFDPFFTTKSVAGGTGLGLSICHNILRAAGGEVTAESQLGRGTTMRVRLPPGRLEKKRLRSGHFPTPAPAGPEAKVVVVDDELLVGRSIRRALRGHDVEVFTSGRAAIDYLRGGARVDVVFCDLMMPEMSGIEVFDAVHRTRPEVAARFVFMTGGAFTPRARAFLERSEHRCLEKPFEVNEVRDLVRDFAGLAVD